MKSTEIQKDKPCFQKKADAIFLSGKRFKNNGNHQG